LEFRVGVQGLGFRVEGVRCRGLGFRIDFRIWGLGLRLEFGSWGCPPVDVVDHDRCVGRGNGHDCVRAPGFGVRFWVNSNVSLQVPYFAAIGDPRWCW
jgi:hypothetical protein